MPLAVLLLFASPALASEDNLLPNGDFEQGLAGWTTEVGATSSDGDRTSVVEVVEGGRSGRALRLSGDSATAIWQSATSEPVEVEPGTFVELSGWIKTDGLRVEGNQFANNYVGLSFPSDQWRPRIAAAVQALESSDWTHFRRVLPVPDGFERVRVLAFRSASGTTSVDDLSLVRVEAPAWKTVSTEHYDFHTLPGASITAEQRQQNEDNLAELQEVLGVELERRIQFWRYPSKATKIGLTGRSANAHADYPASVHTLFPVDRHETTHLLMWLVGNPRSDLLAEGIAVHLSGQWWNEPEEHWVRRYAAEGKVPPLQELADHFRAADDGVSYPVAGSFVGWLIERNGMPTFKVLYASKGKLDRRLEQHYGASLAELEAAWLEWVLAEPAR